MQNKMYYYQSTLVINPKQAWGSEPMYSLGGRLAPPPLLEKGLRE